MVELVEVEDESFETKQPGPDDDDEYYTDTDSEISSDDEDAPLDETLSERLLALKDIIPASTRSYINSACSTTYSYVAGGLSFSGKALFVLSTSALLLGVPWALAFAEEQQMVEMEKEMRMREMGGELLTSGSTAGALNAQLGQQQGKPAL